MEPPPLPKYQDCHELWSKRRRRQLKEQQEAAMGIIGSQVPPGAKPVVPLPGQPGFLGLHKEQRPGYRGGLEEGRGLDSNNGESYLGNSLPTSRSNSPGPPALHYKSQGSHTPPGASDSLTPPQASHRFNNPAVTHDESHPLYRQLCHLVHLINTRQPVVFGQITALMNEQMDVGVRRLLDRLNAAILLAATARERRLRGDSTADVKEVTVEPSEPVITPSGMFGENDSGLLSDGVREAFLQLLRMFNLPVTGLTQGSASLRGQTAPHADHPHRYNNITRVT